MLAAVSEAQALTGIGITAVTSLVIAAFQMRSGAKKSVTDTLMALNEQQAKQIASLESAAKESRSTEEQLRRQVVEQQHEINSLKAQVATLMQGEKFWKDRYHELRDEMA